MTPCDDGMACPTVRTSYIYIYILWIGPGYLKTGCLPWMNMKQPLNPTTFVPVVPFKTSAVHCCSSKNKIRAWWGEKDNSITTFWKVSYLVFLKENRLSAFSQVTSISPKHGHLRPKSCDLFGPRSFWLTVCWLDLPKKSQNHKVAHRLAPFQGNYKLCSIHFPRLIVSPKPDPYPKCCCPQMHKTICIPRFVAVNA